MGRICPVVLSTAMLVLCSCGGNVETPEQRKELADKAGEAAALIYLAVDKPDKELAAAVKVVVDDVKTNLTAYGEGGFIAALPGIEEGLRKIFPKEEDEIRLMAAKKLAKVLLEELDKLFEKHPKWKEMGGEVAGIVGSFCGGASKGFEAYLQT